jgi:hypothetical protein
MGRLTKWATGLGFTPEQIAAAFPPLRQYWRECNRYDRAVTAWERAKRKARDKNRAKCRCDAYKFPHRPGGGLCRYPDPPEVRWQDAQATEIAARLAKFRAREGEPNAEQMADLVALTTKPTRPNRKRYAGILRQIARNSGLHPIRHRDLIEALMPEMLLLAKQLKRQDPRLKYRNMKVTEQTPGHWRLEGWWTTAGPTM